MGMLTFLSPARDEFFHLPGETTWRNVWSLYAAGVLLAIALGVSLYQIGIRRGVDTAKVVPAPTQPNSTPLEAQALLRERYS
jgi:hypothetical protein